MAEIALEELLPRHAAEMYEGLDDVALYRFIAEDPPESLEWLRARYERLSSRRSPNGKEVWLNWIVRRREDQRCLGYVQATIASTGVAEIGYVFLREHQGRGYARAAVEEMLACLRDQHGVELCRANVDTRNRRSIALLEKLGFELHELRREAEWIRGQLTDEAEYRRSI